MGLFLSAIVVAAALAALTDWFFLRLLFRESCYPEIWWPGVRDGEIRGAAIWSAVLGILISAGVVFVCLMAGNPGFWADLFLAIILFLAGPFAVLLVNFQFVKADVWQLVFQLLGYLVRFLIAGAAAGLILPLTK